MRLLPCFSSPPSTNLSLLLPSVRTHAYENDPVTIPQRTCIPPASPGGLVILVSASHRLHGFLGILILILIIPLDEATD